jgi:SPP1 family predicted phage head-tail adaptor
MRDVGGMDRRITIEAPSRSQDGFGDAPATWATFKAVWAKATPLRATERFISQQSRATKASSFLIRYIPGVTPEMRILFDGEYYAITGIAEVGRREALEISAESMERYGEGNA